MPGSCSSGFRSRPSGAAGYEAQERIGREQQEQQEADRDEPHHREHAREHRRRQVARAQRHRERPAGEHQHPQQQRAFVRAPRRGDAVRQRQLRVRVLRDVLDREVAGGEAVREAAERERDEQRTARRAAGRASAISAASRRCAPTSGSVPCASATSSARISAKWPSSGIMRFAVLAASACRHAHLCLLRRLERGGRFGRHVVLVVLGEHLGGAGTCRRAPSGPARPRPCPP